MGTSERELAVSTCVVPFAEGELDLASTLRPGQCFTWDEVEPGVYQGVLRNCLLRFHTTPAAATAAETDTSAKTGVASAAPCPAVDLHCHCTPLFCAPHKHAKDEQEQDKEEEDEWPGAPDPAADLGAFVRWYFRADVSLAGLYRGWQASAHPLARALCHAPSGPRCSPGVRMLRQAPVECVMSFICSQNNRVPRIHALVAALRTHFGPAPLRPGAPARAFPSLTRLAALREAELKELGFGYRAAYVPAAAQRIVERGGAQWLCELAQPSVTAEQAMGALMELKGVGAKVAACVALYALEKHAVVPFDVHMLALSNRVLGRRAGSTRGVSDDERARVGKEYEAAFGEYAGWAQALLFTREIEQAQGTPPAPAKRGRAQEEQEQEQELVRKQPKKKKKKQQR